MHVLLGILWAGKPCGLRIKYTVLGQLQVPWQGCLTLACSFRLPWIHANSSTDHLLEAMAACRTAWFEILLRISLLPMTLVLVLW